MRNNEQIELSDSFQHLADVAYQSGVNSETFGIFVDAGYLGLHHHTVEELKQRKGIPDKENYLDNIGREELSAIDFKNVLTEGKLQQEQVASLDEAMKTHHFVGSEVRKTIEAIHRPMPEDLPSAPSIRKMVEDRHRAAKKRKLKENSQDKNQNTLF